MIPTSEVRSQFVDNFPDNDFTNNPEWTGSSSNFVIDNFKLRLQAPTVSSTSYLSTLNAAINDAQWEFLINMDFNPSSSNFARVYLVSDVPNLEDPLNGYFILIGDTPDEISLYRQTSTSSVKIIDGQDGVTNTATVTVRIKVTRDGTGNWELFYDLNDTGSYISAGTTHDITYRSSNYFGIQCVYTSTRSDKFYFDDFIVTGDPYIDIDPPEVISLEVESSQNILIHFNEELNASSTTLSNYQVDLGIGQPTSVQLVNGNTSALLSFMKSFLNGRTHLLTLTGIADILNNTITSQTQQFFFFEPKPAAAKDIIITEFMADPNPQVSLPDAEFIEIYNRSNDPFNLKHWVLTDGSSNAQLPEFFLLPQEYLVVTSSSNVTKFGQIQNLIGVTNFPTLNNATDTIVLRSSSEVTIDSISYDLTWYKDIDKQEGGWTLEIIDPENICEGLNNWTASENDDGGTPGKQNSAFANNPDMTPPRLINASIVDSQTISLQFDERLEKNFATNVSFELLPSIQVNSYNFADKSLTIIRLALDDVLLPKQLYQIIVNNIFDCSGNLISETHNSISFALPEAADSRDILINEILFNPRTGGSDFVEIVNQSDKYINLKNWNFGNLEDDSIANLKSLFTHDHIISPGEYLVLTPDKSNILTQYPQSIEAQIVQTALPSLPDDEGSIALTSPAGELIDMFLYDDSFHSPFIKDEEGVSLERISLTSNTNERSNWTSASAASGFATPGKVNSSMRTEETLESNEITIDPPVFSTSGSNAFSQVQYKFDKPGLVANVKIFDYQGRQIKLLANNTLLGLEGFFRWDGDQDDGSRARAGYYLVFFEVFDHEGTIKTYRKRIVIASR